MMSNGKPTPRRRVILPMEHDRLMSVVLEIHSKAACQPPVIAIFHLCLSEANKRELHTDMVS
jgi:hypothetical protein